MLELKNISFAPEDGKDIVKDVSFSVEKGQIVAITGPNGSGKSTLAKLISGIYTAKSGKILLDGEDITSLSITERSKKGIGYGFQRPVCFKGFTVRDMLNIAAGKELEKEELKHLLSKVGLCMYDYIDRELNANLSGGEQKRIEIASVLARHVKCNVFDEPEAGIDIWNFQRLINVFDGIRKDGETAQLIISHQRGILEVADKIIVIGAGTIVREGAPKDVLPSLFEEDFYKNCPMRKECGNE